MKDWRACMLMVCTSLWTMSAIAGKSNRDTERAFDAMQMCQALDRTFPRTLSSLSRLGKPRGQVVSDGGAYCLEGENCQVRSLEFDSLAVTVLVKGKTNRVSVLTPRSTSDRLHFFKDLRVGQSLDSVSKKLKVAIDPAAASPVQLPGECISLALSHRNGLVTGLDLDCQLCW